MNRPVNNKYCRCFLLTLERGYEFVGGMLNKTLEIQTSYQKKKISAVIVAYFLLYWLYLKKMILSWTIQLFYIKNNLSIHNAIASFKINIIFKYEINWNKSVHLKSLYCKKREIIRTQDKETLWCMVMNYLQEINKSRLILLLSVFFSLSGTRCLC